MTKPKYSKKSYSWPVFFLLLVLVLIFGTLIIVWSVTRPFCANSLSCKESLSLKVENSEVGVFNGQEVKPPGIDLDSSNIPIKVLGEVQGEGEKHIYIDLTTQTLYAYQGEDLYMSAVISSGKWFETPTGDFTIWQKLKATRMSGGEGNDYYDLPNVPYVMFFYNSKVAAGRGFGLHGAYWHNNFGHPMSHGCINMRIVDAQKLYDWVGPDTVGNITAATPENPGTKITIYGEPPT